MLTGEGCRGSGKDIQLKDPQCWARHVAKRSQTPGGVHSAWLRNAWVGWVVILGIWDTSLHQNNQVRAGTREWEEAPAASISPLPPPHLLSLLSVPVSLQLYPTLSRGRGGRAPGSTGGGGDTGKHAVVGGALPWGALLLTNVTSIRVSFVPSVLAVVRGVLSLLSLF